MEYKNFQPLFLAKDEYFLKELEQSLALLDESILVTPEKLEVMVCQSCGGPTHVRPTLIPIQDISIKHAVLPNAYINITMTLEPSVSFAIKTDKGHYDYEIHLNPPQSLPDSFKDRVQT